MGDKILAETILAKGFQPFERDSEKEQGLGSK